MSFLSSMLPSVVGIGVGAMTGNPMLGAAVAGGLGYAKSGSLMQGITAGLGAYGGAQFAGGLSGLGTSAAGADVAAAAEAQGAEAAQQAMQERIAQQATQQQVIDAAAQKAITPQAIESVASQQAQLNALTPEMYAQSARDAAVNAYTPTAAQQAALDSPMRTGISAALDSPSKLVSQMGGGWNTAKAGLMAAAPAMSAMTPQYEPLAPKSTAQIAPRYSYDPGVANPLPSPSARGVEQNYFPTRGYSQITNDQAKQLYGFADGGDVQGDPNLMQVKTFDPVVRMAGGGASMPKPEVRTLDREPMKKPHGLSDMPGLNETKGLYAAGGLSDLGGYSDGGRLLRGPGDGVSDSIPAMIGKKQPARLADGEFVVPARIVSELGNGSTEAGARQLYAMMDRVQKARGKTVGKGKVAKRNNPQRMLPA